MSYQRWSALTASSYNKIYRQNPPTTKAWNVDTVLKERSQSQGDTAIHNLLHVGYIQSPAQLHLFFMLLPTTHLMSGGKESKSRKSLLNKGGGEGW